MKISVGPLISALASVHVDFSSSDKNIKSDAVQNDGAIGRDRTKSGKELSDLEDILIGIPLKDSNDHDSAPVVHSTRQHLRGTGGGGIISGNSGMVGVFSSNKSLVHGDASTLEIGMYVVLSAFCLAIAIFVMSCVVYASKYRPVVIDANGEASARDGMGHSSVFDIGKGNESCATNAHDWVWLGRATVDRSNTDNIAERAPQYKGKYVMKHGGNKMLIHLKNFSTKIDSRMHIISNPMNSKYDEVIEHASQINSFDNPNHIQLPSSVPFQNRAVNAVSETPVALIDSGTYKKRVHHNPTIR